MTEKENNICDHVTVSIKEHFEVKLKAIQDAVGLARTDMDRRLSELNELRKQVIDDRGQFVTREAYEVTEKERATWRETIGTRVTTIETRSVTWTTVLGILFTLMQLSLGFVLYFLLHK